MGKLEEAEGMKIKEIMTTDVETCMPESTLQEVALKMREINVGSIPICEDDRLVNKSLVRRLFRKFCQRKSLREL